MREEILSRSSVIDQLVGLIQLTRWREHVAFVVPLTVLGALLAVERSNTNLDLSWHLLAAIIGNVLAVAYAFMINDIEDAPDDARDPARAAKNPISSGRIHIRVGYNACRVIAIATLIAYALGGPSVFLIGAATLLLSHLYSWRPVRLKAYPVTDIVSHSLMLSGLLLLAGYFTYDSNPGIVWFVAAGATLFSVYGQLYNQLRDLDMDKAAGLHNTAIILGEANTRRAIYLSIGLALACLLAAVVQGAFPLWLGAALLISVAVSMLFGGDKDMRGSEAVDMSAKMQVRGLVVANLTVMIWLAASLATQFQLI
jgi:4-hydroxybenzoate polyprenyltransferase